MSPTAEDPREPGPDDVDAAFDALVAHWQPSPDLMSALPAEDAEASAEASAAASSPDEEDDDWGVTTPPAVAEPVAEPQEHYVPPPPPPIPRGDRVTRWAWAGAVGAPLLFFVLALSGQSVGGLFAAGLLAAFGAGFVTLVLRMRDGPTIDDRPDDGAVV